MKIIKVKEIASWVIIGIFIIPVSISLIFSVPYQAVTSRDLQLNGKYVNAKIIDFENINTKSGLSRRAKFQYKVDATVYTVWLGVDEAAKKGDTCELHYAPSFPWHARYKQANFEAWDKDLYVRVFIGLFFGLLFMVIWLYGTIAAYKKARLRD